MMLKAYHILPIAKTNACGSINAFRKLYGADNIIPKYPNPSVFRKNPFIPVKLSVYEKPVSGATLVSPFGNLPIGLLSSSIYDLLHPVCSNWHMIFPELFKKDIASLLVSRIAICPMNSIAFMQSIVQKATVIVSAIFYSFPPLIKIMNPMNMLGRFIHTVVNPMLVKNPIINMLTNNPGIIPPTMKNIPPTINIIIVTMMTLSIGLSPNVLSLFAIMLVFP